MQFMSDNSPALSTAHPRCVPLSWWVYLLLAVLCIGVYANSVVNSYALDDVAVVQENNNVTNLEWTSIWSSNYWSSDRVPAVDVLYRPLTVWSFLANQAFSPNNPMPFHGVNILLHALVTVLGTALAWRLSGSRAVALVAGALFAVHPIHTEVVANVVGRAELLAAVFSILSLLVFLPNEPIPTLERLTTRSPWHGLLLALTFFAAVLSKETPAALLAAFPMIDVWRWSRVRPEGRPSLVRWLAGQTVRYYVPVFVMLCVYLAMRIHGAGLMRDINRIHPIVNPLILATPLERVITPFALIAEYVKLVLWPRVLSSDYSAPSLMPTANPTEPMALAGILIVMLLGIVVVRQWKRRSPICLVVALLGCSYALVGNFLRIGTIFGERLFYWPSLFFFMLVGWVLVSGYASLAETGAKRAVRLTAAGLAAVAVVAMSVRTIIRNTDWADNTTLAIATARDNPRSAKACYWAGTVLAMSPDRKWADVGELLFKRSAEQYPTFSLPYWELAKLYGRRNELAKSALYLAKATEYSSGDPDLRVAVRSIQADFRRIPEGKYMGEIEQRIREKPEDASGYFARSLVELAKSDVAGAKRDLRAALTHDGTFHEAAYQLALVELKSPGDEEHGIHTMKVYLNNVTTSYEAYCTAAESLLNLDSSRFPTALADAEQDIQAATALVTEHPGMRRLLEMVRRKHAEQAAQHGGELTHASVRGDSTAGETP